MMRLKSKITDDTILGFSWLTAMSAKLPPSPFLKAFLERQGERYGRFGNTLFHGAGRGRNLYIAEENELDYYAYDINFDKLRSKIPDELLHAFQPMERILECSWDLVVSLYVFNTITNKHQQELALELAQINANTYVIAVRNDVVLKEPLYGDGYISRQFKNGGHTYQENFNYAKIKALLEPHFIDENYRWYGNSIKGALTIVISRSVIVGMEEI